jgi:predicted nuclease of predicted toxin-antitoxin system
LSKIKFYFDESVELAASEQTLASGLDAVSAHSLEALGDKDTTHLARATQMGRVLCTYDADFLRLASTGLGHAGIVYAKPRKISIGGWIRELRSLHARQTAEEMIDQVIFLSSH